MDRIVDTFASAEALEGFVWRATEIPPGVEPYLYDSENHQYPTQTLSVWTNLEAPYAYAYTGRHAEALRHRKEWFVKPDWPTYVAWWVDNNHQPTWQEGYERLGFMHRNGPSPFAFNFRTPFDAQGRSAQVSHERVRKLAPTVL